MPMCGEMRSLSLAAVIAGVVLIPFSVRIASAQRAGDRSTAQRTLVTAAHDEATALQDYFARARSIDLLTAHNPGFLDFYKTGGRGSTTPAHAEALAESTDALD